MQWEYRRIIFKRAWRAFRAEAVSLRTIFTEIIGFGAGLGVLRYMGRNDLVSESILNFVVFSVGGAFAAGIVLFIGYLIATPAKIFDELGGFAKPRITGEPRCYDGADQKGREWLKIIFRNGAPDTIEDCTVDLVRIITQKEEREYKRAWLTWSGIEDTVERTKRSQRITIRPDRPATVDIAIITAVGVNDLLIKTMKFLTPGVRIDAYPGKYTLELVFRGYYNDRCYEKALEFTFEFSEDNGFSCNDTMFEMELENARRKEKQEKGRA